MFKKKSEEIPINVGAHRVVIRRSSQTPPTGVLSWWLIQISLSLALISASIFLFLANFDRQDLTWNTLSKQWMTRSWRFVDAFPPFCFAVSSAILFSASSLAAVYAFMKSRWWGINTRLFHLGRQEHFQIFMAFSFACTFFLILMFVLAGGNFEFIPRGRR